MKKYIIIAVAALVAMCACTKNEVVTPDREITFSVGTFVGQTKADETKPADYADNYSKVPFGTYAWFYGKEGDEPQVFMVDEKVSLSGGEWKPAKTYYWPKSGSIDFISYSPQSISEFVTIDEETITIGEDYVVEHETNVDVMYADKAIGCTENVETYYYEGVPTLFRHALAKINVNVKTAYDKKVVTEGEDETAWTITVTKLSIQNYYNTGSVEFALDSDNAWALPKGEVWDNNDETVDEQVLLGDDDDPVSINSTTNTALVEDYFVLPQNLDAEQTLEITVDIVTLLPNGKTIKESGVVLSGLMSNEDLTAWKINKNITYDLIITPAAGPEDEPIAILFDPAVEDWVDSDPASVTISK